MKKFKYKEIKISQEKEYKICKIINKEGKNGWEFMSKIDGEKIWNPVYDAWDGRMDTELLFKKQYD